MSQVRFTASRKVELDDGVTLVPGRYGGRSTQPALMTYQGISATRTMYLLELSAEQIWSMGGSIRPNVDSLEFDVTKYVESGEILPY